MRLFERTISFFSDGIRHAGRLFVPTEGPESGNIVAGSQLPGVVVCHGYGGTMSFIVGDIARRFAELGYATLIFDYRGFGESDGERWRLIPHEQVQDIVDAVTFLQLQPEIDPERVSLFGTSFGAANVVYAGVRHPDIRCVISSIGFADGELWLRSLRRHWEWLEFRRRLAADRQRRVVTGRSEVVDPDEIMLRDPESQRYNEMLLATYRDRKFALPLETAERIIEFKPVDVVNQLSPKALLIVRAGADALMGPEHGQLLYNAAREPKALVDLAGVEHHAVYHGEPLDRLMLAVDKFLRAHL